MKIENEYIIELLESFGEVDHIFLDYKYNQEYINAIAKKNKILPIINFYRSGVADFNFKLERLLYLRLLAIQDLIKSFDEENINYVILKGVYLSTVAYRRVDLRTMNDIDFLIDVKDTEKIKKLCKEYGWSVGKVNRNNWTIIDYDRKQEIAFKLNTHQIATMAKILEDGFIGTYDCVLDFNYLISWGNCSNKDLLNFNFLNYKKKVIDYFGFQYYVLEDEYYLIQLCLHLYKESNDLFFIYSNNGLFLRGFVDILYFVNNANIDIDKLKIIIQKSKSQSYVYFVFWYITHLFSKNVEKSLIIYKVVETICNENDRGIVEYFGLENNKHRWNNSVIDRFFSIELNNQNNLTKKEIEKIKLIKDKFY